MGFMFAQSRRVLLRLTELLQPSQQIYAAK